MSLMATQIRKENLLALYGILFQISSKGSFYMHHPIHSVVNTTAFYNTSCEELAGNETHSDASSS